jgi:oxygen-independent coproporphyrinogen-3 oxidase
VTCSKKTGLYIHIPFCRSKCSYCDFYSKIESESTVSDYVSAVISEIKSRERFSQYISGNLLIDTIYFGGGTPSLLSCDDFSRLMRAIRENTTVTDDCEITVECNPSSVSSQLFDTYKKTGVNRVSIGLQSAIDEERKILGRVGTKKDVTKAIELCKKSGIDNISLDVMLAIPNQTEKSLCKTLSFCNESGALHISAYILKIEKGTLLYDTKKELNLPDEEKVCSLYELCCDKLFEYGFQQYEISNFAKDSFCSRHNLKYWTLEDYIGIGPAAHSFFGGKRFYFPPDTKLFIDGIQPISDGFGGGIDEYIMLNLRLSQGIDLDEMSRRYGIESVTKIKEKAIEFIPDCLLEIHKNRLYLTRKGFLLSNTIISELIN